MRELQKLRLGGTITPSITPSRSDEIIPLRGTGARGRTLSQSRKTQAHSDVVAKILVVLAARNFPAVRS
jgi:hypothetical protein